jgi:hypothetical protein
MRIVDDAPVLMTTVPYFRARSGGGTEAAELVVERIRVDRVPRGCTAVIAAGDLQGVTASPWGGEPVLLGIALADYIAVWSEQGRLPPPEEIGVVLTGDLYSAPQADRRGASGDVADVWLAIAATGCRLLVGVAGNHDLVSGEDVAAISPESVLLDGTIHRYGGMLFAGISGIIGDPKRQGRTAEPAFLGHLDRLLAQDPSVLILHEGPSGLKPGQLGNPVIRERMERRSPGLTLCGHVHWNQSVSRLGTGHVVNVDDRVVVFAP